MIAIFIAISDSIIDSGFSNALIRKVDIKREDYNTVFFFNLIVGISLYVLLFFCSPAISEFFKEPLLVPVTRVIGLVLVINALSIIQRTIFVKEINFKIQTKISFIASISSGVIGIGMALLNYGVWSLVAQQLSRQFFNALFLWIYSHWRPAWEFSIESFKELFGFGSKLLVSGLIDTAYRNVYYVVIGRFYSSSQLGQYTRAGQFNTIFSSNLTAVVQRVSYPVLSSIQEDPERLLEGYRKIIKMTMLVAFSCMLGLAAIAKPLILVLIGEKWLQSVYYLQIICFSGMLYPLQAINLNILQVKGRSDLFLKLEIIKKVIAVGPIVIGIFWGIEYMLWGSVFTSFIAYFLNSYYSADLVNYPTKKQIMDIFPSFLVSFFIAGVMWCITLFSLSIYVMLPLQCLTGLILAILVYEKLRLPEYLEVRQLVCSLLHRKNKLDNKQIWTKN